MAAQAPPSMFPGPDMGSGFPGAAGAGFPGEAGAGEGSAGGFPGAGGLPPNATAGGMNPFAQTAGPPPGAIPTFPFFTPSFDVALAGAIVFFALAVIHTYLVFRTKAAYFGLAAQAVLAFAVGMILRVVVITNQSLFGVFTISTLLLSGITSLVGIVLIFTFTRLMWFVTPAKHRNFSTLWLPPMAHSFTLAFAQTIADVIGTLGTGQIIKPPPPRLTAVGAVIEMLVWMYFSLLVMRFTLISRRWPMEQSVREKSTELGVALSVCTVLLVIRGIFQVLEKDAITSITTTFRPTPVVQTDEWPFYVFGILPNLLIFAILAVFHPGFYLPRRLTGFRLKTIALVKEEKEKGADRGSSSQASNGWTISSPRLMDPEKANGLGVASLYANAYAMQDEKQGPYTRTTQINMGYAR